MGEISALSTLNITELALGKNTSELFDDGPFSESDTSTLSISELVGVRRIPKWFDIIPFFGTNISFVIPPNIFLTEAILEGLYLGKPHPNSIAVLRHEQVHIQRAKEYGSLNWATNYILNKEFRLREELIAVVYEMVSRYTVVGSDPYNIERMAGYYASSEYLWMCEHERALYLLGWLDDHVRELVGHSYATADDFESLVLDGLNI